jgi:hypothetical protein
MATRAKVNPNNKQAWIVIDQIRTVVKPGIIKILDQLTDQEIAGTKLTIRATLVDK